MGNNLNYSGGALSTDGILYIGTQSNNKVLGLDITNGNIVLKRLWDNRSWQLLALARTDGFIAERSDLIISVR